MKGMKGLVGVALLSTATSFAAQPDPYWTFLPQAPSTKATLTQVLENMTENLGEEKEIAYVYSPRTGIVFDVSSIRAEEHVSTDFGLYSNTMWKNDVLYDIHTHPSESSDDAKHRGLVVTAEQLGFRNRTPSPGDIYMVAGRSIEFYRRQPDGSIRFFIAARDASRQAALIEVALRPERKEELRAFAKESLEMSDEDYKIGAKAILNLVASDYDLKFFLYKIANTLDFETWSEKINKTSPYMTLHRYCPDDLTALDVPDVRK